MGIRDKLGSCARRNKLCCQIFCVISFFLGSGFIIGGSYLTDKYSNKYNCFNEFYCEDLGGEQIYFSIGVALLVFGFLLLVVSALVLCCYYANPEINKQISKIPSVATTPQIQLQYSLLPTGSYSNAVALSVPLIPQTDSQINLSQQAFMHTAPPSPYRSELLIPRPFPPLPPASDQSTNFSSTLSVPRH